MRRPPAARKGRRAGLAPETAQRVALTVFGAQRQPVVSVWLDGTHPHQEIACRDGSGPPIRLDVSPDRPLLVKVETRGLGGDVELVGEALPPRPANDHLADAAVVAALPFTDTVELAGATVEAGEQSPAACYGALAGSAWYRYAAPEAQTLIVRADGQGSAVTVSIWQGTGHPLRELRCDQLYPGQPVETLPRLALEAGATVLLRLERPDPASTSPMQATLVLAATGGGSRPTPSNDDLAGAAPVGDLPFEVPLGLAGATLEPGEAASSCGGTGEGSLWFALQPAEDVEARLTASSSQRGLDVSVWTGSAHPLAEVDCAFGGSLSLPLDGGTRYLVRVAGGSLLGEVATLRIEPPPAPPANDDLAAAIAVDGLPFAHRVDTSGATSEPGEQFCGGGRSVWYRFVPEVAGAYELNTLGSSYDTTLSVWTGMAHPLSMLACNDDVGDGQLKSRLVLDLDAGTTYWVRVDGYGGASGLAQLNVASTDATPMATSPRPATAPVGDATPEPGTPRSARLLVPVALAAWPVEGAASP